MHVATLTIYQVNKIYTADIIRSFLFHYVGHKHSKRILLIMGLYIISQNTVTKEHKMKIAFIGGDFRMNHACAYLIKKGYNAELLNYDSCPTASLCEYHKLAKSADVIVLPAPVSVDKMHINGTSKSSGGITVNELIYDVKDNASVFYGRFNNFNKITGIKYIDYLNDEAYLTDSAYLTAEGTVGHLLLNYRRALYNRKILLIGWGRIAKFLYTQLSFYTDKISVALRNEKLINELANNNISANNFEHLSEFAMESEIIINTVPALILGNKVLERLDKQTYIIDLASLPGGIDFDSAQKLGIETHHLLALPGKCAPESAGTALGKCIYSHLCNIAEDERNDCS